MTKDLKPKIANKLVITITDQTADATKSLYVFHKNVAAFVVHLKARE